MSDGGLQQMLTPEWWNSFAYVATRVGGMMMVAPMWTLEGVPRRIRATVTLVLSVALLPAAPQVGEASSMVVVPVELVVEFLVGLTIGLTAAVLVHGAAMAGEVISHQMGLNLGPSAANLSELLVPGVGQIKSVLAVLLYLAVGGHHMVLRGLADSLEVIPPGSMLNLAGVGAVATELLGVFFTAAVMTAAPALVALLLINVTVALVSRAVPQIHAMLVMFPATIGTGLVVLGLGLPLIGGTLAGWMDAIPARIATTLQLLSEVR